MTKRSFKIYIQDILDSIDKINDYTSGLTYSEFTENELVKDSVVRNLQIIGEAANNIPSKIQNSETTIPWRQIIGLRNMLVHEYFGIDYSIVWEIIKTDLPSLKKKIEVLNARSN